MREYAISSLDLQF